MAVKKSPRRGQERRAERAEARLSMRIEGAPVDGARAQIVTESQNISSSGVYCVSSYFLAPASRVMLAIVLPRVPGTLGGKELIKCDGIVVRCQSPAKRGDKGFELACMFVGLDERRRQLLEAFVTWRNLQALRAAAGRADSGRRAARPRPPGRKAGASARPTATRRRTVH